MYTRANYTVYCMVINYFIYFLTYDYWVVLGGMDQISLAAEFDNRIHYVKNSGIQIISHINYIKKCEQS